MKKNIVLNIIAYVVLLFLFIPLLIVSVTAFNNSNIIEFPIKGFSFQWFLKAFNSKDLMNSMKVSFYLAILSSIISVILGGLASIAIVKRPSKISNFMKELFLTPTIIPMIVIGFILYHFMIIFLHLNIILALILGHIILILPFSIRIITAALSTIDPSIEEAALSLGCGKFNTFFSIILPNLSSAISASFMLSFINSFNNIPISIFLKAPGLNTLPYAMINYIELNYDPTVSAISVILMIATILIMLFIEKTVGISSIS